MSVLAGKAPTQHLKDGKFAEVQVVLSLMLTVDGYPIGYKVTGYNSYRIHGWSYVDDDQFDQ